MVPGAEGLVGHTIGEYRLHKLIAKGGMAAVFEAHLASAPYSPHTVVAIKVLVLPWQASDEDRAAFQARFRREAEVLQRLRHPHILTILYAGEDAGFTYMVLPFMSGGTLATRLVAQRGPLPLPEAASYIEQVASALDYAHSQHVVHRDIKPANVLLDGHGNAYLADFSIVRLFDNTRTTITAAGQVLGTQEYMAPEQFGGGEISTAADIYSLGIVLYQLVTGQVPFQSTSFYEILKKHMQDPPPPPRTLRPELPEPAEAAILRALAKQPADRFATAEEFAQAFQLGLQGHWAVGAFPSAARSQEETGAFSLPPTETIPVLPPTLVGGTQPPVIGAEPPLPQRETSPAPPPASAVVLAGEATDQARLPDVKVPTQPPKPMPEEATKPAGTSGPPSARAAAFPHTIAQDRQRRDGLGQSVMRVGLAAVLVATLIAGLEIYLYTHGGGSTGGPGTASTPQPVYGGTLTDGIRIDPDSLLPQGSVYPDTAQVDEAIWAPLFYGDPSGRIKPALASGFDLSADGKTYTIHLRTGLTWSDGNPLTAADVVFTVNLLKNPHYGANGLVPLNEIASATASDSSTVNITLTTVDPTFLGNALTDAFNFAPLPRSVFGSMDPTQVLTSSDNSNSWPKVVSGPFTIQSRVTGHSITLVKNTHYFQAPQPYLDGITFTVASATEALSSLQANMLTNSWNMPASDLTTLRNIAGYSTIADQVPLRLEAMYLNETNPILADAKVRKALSMSLDMKTLRDTVWNGLAGPVCDDGVGTFAYEAAATCYSYDVTQAKSLLATDGWTMGSDGYRHKNGQTLELRYTTPSENAALVQAGLFAQENWKQNIGLKLDMFNQAIGQLFQTITKSYQNYDIVAFTYTPNGYDPDNHTFWACDQLTTNNGFNFSHYCNPTVDAAIKQELGTNNQQTRLNAFHTIYQQIVNDVPVIYFSTDPTISCATKKLKNYAPSSLVAGETWNVWDWYLTH